jgi:arylesterase/paraoxonase
MHTDLPMDNLSVDKDGAVWAAAFPKGKDLIEKHIPDPLNNPSATTAVRITLNTGSRSAFFGEKYKVEKVRFWHIRLVECTGLTRSAHEAF